MVRGNNAVSRANVYGVVGYEELARHLHVLLQGFRLSRRDGKQQHSHINSRSLGADQSLLFFLIFLEQPLNV